MSSKWAYFHLLFKILNMSRAKMLSDYERGQIDALNGEGMSSRKMVNWIKRSKTVVKNYLSDQKNYGKKKHTGGRSSLTPREKGEFWELLVLVISTVDRLTTNWDLSSGSGLDSYGHFKYKKKDPATLFERTS